jgi:c-di-GMP-binding flagellar brake protein YcgR
MDSSRADSEPTALDQEKVRKERRAHPRLNCKGVAEFRILPEGPKLFGFLTNLGMGGCSIECDKEIPATAAYAAVEVQMDVDDYRLRLAGCIRHIEDEIQAGIQFTDVSSRKEEQIRILMEELVEMEKHRLEAAKTMRKDAGEE